VAVEYRVVSFGKPQGPWRDTERRAENDAVAQGLAEYDEWGQLYLDATTSIEWRFYEELRRSALAHREGCMRRPAPRS
jgi:hypothetical protein